MTAVCCWGVFILLQTGSFVGGLMGKRLLLIGLITSLVLSGAAMADTIGFSGTTTAGQGQLTFTAGGTVTVGPDASGNLGALINLLQTTPGACSGAGCTVTGNTGTPLTGGYLTLTSGNQISGSNGYYTFGSGGSLDIYGGVASLGITDGSLLLSASFAPGSSFSVGGTT